MVTVGWILAREFIKLYVARQAKRLGSRIRTKLVVGAMLLSCVPVFFLVLWSYEVLNYNLKAWFTNPVDNQVEVYKQAARGAGPGNPDPPAACRPRCWRAQPETAQLLAGGAVTPGALQRFAPMSRGWNPPPSSPLGHCRSKPGDRIRHGRATARPPWSALPLRNGTIELSARIPLDAGQQLLEIKKFSDEWAQIVGNRQDYRTLYIMLMVLITLFVLFVATWLARLPGQPDQHADHRASGGRRRGAQRQPAAPRDVRAEDELALLVHGFNQMTEALESSSLELDRAPRFTEAILESIPTGVISIGADGSIQRVNRALAKIFPAGAVARGHAPGRSLLRAKTPPRSST